MKYTDKNKPLQCFMRQSTWYKNTGNVSIKGVLWHSTGANNPNLKRYVQPDDNVSNKQYLISKLGSNTAKNDWNHINVQSGVHAFIGKLADGTISTVQVGPWDKQAWGCGTGKKGTCNNGWIQFEICEDGLNDKTYFDKVYKEACELTAYLCVTYNLNPYGNVTYNNVKVPVILCHADSYKLGLGSNHSDVLHWFSKFGKTMEDVRKDVKIIIDNQKQINNISQEGDTMLEQKDFNNMFVKYRNSLQNNYCSSWSKEAREWAISTGLIQGSDKLLDGTPNYMWQDFLTREQLVMFLYRFQLLQQCQKL